MGLFSIEYGVPLLSGNGSLLYDFSWNCTAAAMCPKNGEKNTNKRLFLMNNYLLKADFAIQRVFEVKSSTNQVQGVQRSLYDFFWSKILPIMYTWLKYS